MYVCRSAALSVCLHACLSVCLAVCLSVCMSRSIYCPQSFSGGGLYSKGNVLLLLLLLLILLLLLLLLLLQLLLLLLLTGGKSGGELLTLFDSYSYDGVFVCGCVCVFASVCSRARVFACS